MSDDDVKALLRERFSVCGQVFVNENGVRVACVLKMPCELHGEARARCPTCGAKEGDR